MKYIAEQFIENIYLNENSENENYIIQILKNNIISKLMEEINFEIKIIKYNEDIINLAIKERDDYMVNLLMRLKLNKETKYIIEVNINE